MREYNKLTLSLLWFLVTSTSGVLSSVAASFFGVYTLGMGLLVFGTVVSFCIACAQMFSLRRRLPSVNWNQWLLISTAAGTAGWFLVHALMVLGAIANALDVARSNTNLQLEYLEPFVISALSGLVYGAIQTYGFRIKPHYFWWCVANALGLGIGTVLGLQIADSFVPAKPGMLLGFDDAVHISIAGGMATLLMSVFTGLVILLFPNKANVEESNSGLEINSPSSIFR